jgi:hypothetical protein
MPGIYNKLRGVPVVCRACGKSFGGRGSYMNHTKYDKDCTDAMRFWSRVDKRGPDECWLWTGAAFRKSKRQMGYGRRAGSGPNTYAHRVAYMLAKGPIPKGKLVMHTCDVPLCCNPAHLLIGTNAENAADRVAKGRHLGAKPLPIDING